MNAPTQHGFTSGRSCSTAWAELYDYWTRGVDRGMYIGIYLTDQSSAFEVVDPKILDAKLKALKFKKATRQLISTYLDNRAYVTRIGNKTSEKAYKSIGVAPGSKIGPFLYSVYISDLPKTTDGLTICYADDASCSTVHQNPEKVVENMEKDAKAITNYMRANRLCLAEDKSSFLLANSKQKHRSEDVKNMSLDLGANIIQQDRTAKILGLTINNNLEFTDFLFGDQEEEEEGLIKKLKKRLGMGRKVSSLPFKQRKMVMSGIFMGKLAYGIEIYGASTKGQLRQLQSLQNRAARMVTKNPRAVSSKECLMQCGWLNVEDMINLRTLTLGYNIRLTESVPGLTKYIGRGRKDMSAEIVTYEQGQVEHVKLFSNSTIPRFQRLWNGLPKEVRASSPKEFKNKVKYMLKNTKDEDEVEGQLTSEEM